MGRKTHWPTSVVVDPKPNYQLGWNKDETGWWYADTKNTYPRSKWEKIKEKWHYFDGNGYAYQSRWLFNLDDDRWYYFDDNCYMVTGFQVVDGKPYFFNKDGAVYSGNISLVFATDKDNVLIFKGVNE
jgi:glucan-binding YG repeat protein